MKILKGKQTHIPTVRVDLTTFDQLGFPNDPEERAKQRALVSKKRMRMQAFKELITQGLINRPEESILDWLFQASFYRYEWQGTNDNIFEPWMFDPEWHAQYRRRHHPWNSTFHFFPKLPLEIRLLIWDAALPTTPAANYFELIITDDEENQGSDVVHPTKYALASSKDSRNRSAYIIRDVLSQVNRETRAHMRRESLMPIDIEHCTNYGMPKPGHREWDVLSDGSEECHNRMVLSNWQWPTYNSRRIYVDPKNDIMVFEGNLRPYYRCDTRWGSIRVLDDMFAQFVHIGFRPGRWMPFWELESVMRAFTGRARWHLGGKSRHLYIFDTVGWPNLAKPEPVDVEVGGLHLRHHVHPFNRTAFIEDTNGAIPLVWTASLSPRPDAKTFAEECEKPYASQLLGTTSLRMVLKTARAYKLKDAIKSSCDKGINEVVVDERVARWRFPGRHGPYNDTVAERAFAKFVTQLPYPQERGVTFNVHLVRRPPPHGRRFTPGHNYVAWKQTMAEQGHVSWVDEEDRKEAFRLWKDQQPVDTWLQENANVLGIPHEGRPVRTVRCAGRGAPGW